MIVGRRIAGLFSWGLSIASSLFLYACSNDSSVESEYEEGNLNVGASIAKEIFTRESNTGTVKSGTYYLSYPDANNNYTVAAVNFGYDDTNPQIGKVATSDDKPFKWDLVGGATPVFYLDNVAPVPGQENPMVVDLIDDTRFKAGIYDTMKFTNDLLWGTQTVQRNTGTIHFDLHHNMSRVRVMVTADKTYEHDNSLDLEGAVVQITNVNLKPESFNRADGTLTLGDNPDNFGPITLVNESVAESEAGYTGWSSDWTNENDCRTYISHSCIVPPQMLAEDDTRSRLTITLKNGTSFSGVLPHAMEIDPPASAETTNPYPVTLSFLKEHLITIRTVISETPPSLAFMPVKVIEWVDKGEFDLVAHQAGIYTSAEFFKMMEYYGRGNNYQLLRYGPLDQETELWTFNFFSTIIIQVTSMDKLKGKMIPDNGDKHDYSFQFNGYSVFVQIGTQDPKEVSPDQLRNILKGTSSSPFSS